eukprot:6567852-Pyramimonas_sp.AAC.2
MEVSSTAVSFSSSSEPPRKAGSRSLSSAVVSCSLSCSERLEASSSSLQWSLWWSLVHWSSDWSTASDCVSDVRYTTSSEAAVYRLCFSPGCAFDCASAVLLLRWRTSSLLLRRYFSALLREQPWDRE